MTRVRPMHLPHRGQGTTRYRGHWNDVVMLEHSNGVVTLTDPFGTRIDLPTLKPLAPATILGWKLDAHAPTDRDPAFVTITILDGEGNALVDIHDMYWRTRELRALAEEAGLVMELRGWELWHRQRRAVQLAATGVRFGSPEKTPRENKIATVLIVIILTIGILSAAFGIAR